MAEVTNIDLDGEVMEFVDEEAREAIIDVDAKAQEATNIAKGRNQAHVFATTADMETFLSNPDNAGKYNKGDNIYIVELEVPDWWIAEVLTEADADTGYYYKIGQLETQKVDLTNYLSTDDHVLVWRSNQIEGDDWAKAKTGVWHTKVANDTYGIHAWTIIYKPQDDSFNGAFLNCYASGSTQKGIYAWDNTTSTFVRLPRKDELDEINNNLKIFYSAIKTTNIPTGAIVKDSTGRKRLCITGYLGTALTAGEEKTLYTNVLIAPAQTAVSKYIILALSATPIFAHIRIGTDGVLTIMPFSDVPTTQYIRIDETYI